MRIGRKGQGWGFGGIALALIIIIIIMVAIFYIWEGVTSGGVVSITSAEAYADAWDKYGDEVFTTEQQPWRMLGFFIFPLIIYFCMYFFTFSVALVGLQKKFTYVYGNLQRPVVVLSFAMAFMMLPFPLTYSIFGWIGALSPILIVLSIVIPLIGAAVTFFALSNIGLGGGRRDVSDLGTGEKEPGEEPTTPEAKKRAAKAKKPGVSLLPEDEKKAENLRSLLLQHSVALEKYLRDIGSKVYEKHHAKLNPTAVELELYTDYKDFKKVFMEGRNSIITVTKTFKIFEKSLTTPKAAFYGPAGIFSELDKFIDRIKPKLKQIPNDVKPSDFNGLMNLLDKIKEDVFLIRELVDKYSRSK